MSSADRWPAGCTWLCSGSSGLVLLMGASIEQAGQANLIWQPPRGHLVNHFSVPKLNPKLETAAPAKLGGWPQHKPQALRLWHKRSAPAVLLTLTPAWIWICPQIWAPTLSRKLPPVSPAHWFLSPPEFSGWIVCSILLLINHALANDSSSSLGFLLPTRQSVNGRTVRCSPL